MQRLSKQRRQSRQSLMMPKPRSTLKKHIRPRDAQRPRRELLFPMQTQFHRQLLRWVRALQTQPERYAEGGVFNRFLEATLNARL